MTYLALARKWRPQTFAQLVGQPSISKAIIKSLDQERLHHAYLFTGTRGVGKTSIARLIAKALNCEQGVSSTPCLHCNTCLSVEQGRFVDLIEIDAASRTRVEDTRALLDNVHYAPSFGRYKIYLIDEVHMLSQHSFNALLKTLEEPPEHVKFLLATTDPQKLPITVLSRCLQFNLKALDLETIAGQLEKILQAEQLAFEPQAIHLIAKAASGSMRDALSLLDQAIASMDERLTSTEVKAMLGFTQRDFAYELLQTLITMNASQITVLCREIAEEGGYFNYVLTTILEYLHEAAMLQIVPNKVQNLCGATAEGLNLASQLNAEDIQLFYQIGLKGLEELQLAPSLAIGFEMTILRMYTFKPATKATLPPLAHESSPLSTPSSIEAQMAAPTAASVELPSSETQRPKEAAQTKNSTDCKLQDSFIHPNTESWPLFIEALELSGLALNALENSVFIEKTQNILYLKVTKGHQALFTPATLQRIEQSIQNYCHEAIQIQLKVEEQVLETPAKLKQKNLDANRSKAQTQLQNDPYFNQISQKFSAELVKNSIEVLKDPL